MTAKPCCYIAESEKDGTADLALAWFESGIGQAAIADHLLHSDPLETILLAAVLPGDEVRHLMVRMVFRRRAGQR